MEKEKYYSDKMVRKVKRLLNKPIFIQTCKDKEKVPGIVVWISKQLENDRCFFYKTIIVFEDGSVRETSLLTTDTAQVSPITFGEVRKSVLSLLEKQAKNYLAFKKAEDVYDKARAVFDIKENEYHSKKAEINEKLTKARLGFTQEDVNTAVKAVFGNPSSGNHRIYTTVRVDMNTGCLRYVEFRYEEDAPGHWYGPNNTSFLYTEYDGQLMVDSHHPVYKKKVNLFKKDADSVFDIQKKCRSFDYTSLYDLNAGDKGYLEYSKELTIRPKVPKKMTKGSMIKTLEAIKNSLSFSSSSCFKINR